MRCFIVLVALVGLVRCGPVEGGAGGEAANSIRECLDGEPVLCLKEKALRYTERLSTAKKIDIADGLTIMTTGSPRSARSYEPLSDDPKSREAQIDERIADSVGDLLDNTVIQFRLPTESTQDESRALEEEGRGKKKKKIKKLLPLLLLLKLKLFALVPIFLGIIAFVAVKALFLGKIAFLAQSVSLIRKLISAKGSFGGSSFSSGAAGYSYNAQPVHEEHGWDSGSSGWGRKAGEAQGIAYSAQAQ